CHEVCYVRSGPHRGLQRLREKSVKNTITSLRGAGGSDLRSGDKLRDCGQDTGTGTNCCARQSAFLLHGDTAAARPPRKIPPPRPPPSGFAPLPGHISLRPRITFLTTPGDPCRGILPSSMG